METSDGAVDGLLIRIVNSGSQDDIHELWLSSDATVNGFLFRRGVKRQDGNRVVLVGCDLYARAKFDCISGTMPSTANVLPEVNGFDYWGIKSVESLSFFSDPDGEWITFCLASPLERSAAPATPAEHLLFSSDGLVVNLRQVTAELDAYVVFSVLNADGTGYALGPVPYLDAAAD